VRLGSFTLLKALALSSLTTLPATALDGYVFVAPGAIGGRQFTNGTLHVGGGVEKLFRERIGVSAEIGALGLWNNYRGAIGIFSVNGSYHFGDRAGKVDPFVTGGYSLGFRSATLNFGNFGGGVNYWFRDGLGLRVEFRDHVHAASRANALHYWGVRFGLAFR
jgi:hypothetical protein